jgi:hypothetical protein
MASLHDALGAGGRDSPEHRALVRAIAKARGDRARAVRNVCRLYQVKTLGALPRYVQAVLRETIGGD